MFVMTSGGSVPRRSFRREGIDTRTVWKTRADPTTTSQWSNNKWVIKVSHGRTLSRLPIQKSHCVKTWAIRTPDDPITPPDDPITPPEDLGVRVQSWKQFLHSPANQRPRSNARTTSSLPFRSKPTSNRHGSDVDVRPCCAGSELQWRDTAIRIQGWKRFLESALKLRYFNLPLRLNKESSLFCQCNGDLDIRFDQILREIKRYLDKHSTEFVIINIQNLAETTSTELFDNAVNCYLDKYNNPTGRRTQNCRKSVVFSYQKHHKSIPTSKKYTTGILSASHNIIP